MNNSYLICVDAGHGGSENGATYNGRLEKDDNLRLALEVEKQLLNLGQRVIMTRTSDVTVTLAQRANIANESGANLFISLHRDSFEEQTPWTNGVTNYIYTSAPESYAVIAEIVLQEVVSVGVQSNKGVRRGNYYVLRNTTMPSMLLEMGYIINETDNNLLDENLVPYAQAIARGIVQGLNTYSGGGNSGGGNGQGNNANRVRQVQRMLNNNYRAGLTVDGVYGPDTRRALVMAVQMELNEQYGASLSVDGAFGPATKEALPILRNGDRGNLVMLLQAALNVHGYDTGGLDGVYGSRTRSAVLRYQAQTGLLSDGLAGPDTFERLLTAI